MRSLFIFISSLICVSLKATTYYVAASGGTGAGTSPATAWSYAKLNSAAINPGDIVRFNRGDVFYGTLTVKSGSLGNPVIYATYGTGAKPIITGLVQATSWTLYSGNIYYSTLTYTNPLSIVVIDGAAQKMGRYPNTGWRTITGINGNTQFSDSLLPDNPSFVGGQAVLRKVRYIIDRGVIKTQASGVIGLANAFTASSIEGNNTRQPVLGNGYFIQNHPNCLDLDKEWAYDSATKRLYVYFADGTPANHVVKASSIDYNINFTSKQYIEFDSLDFEGANIRGFSISSTSYVTINDSKFTAQGGSAVYGNTVTALTMKRDTIYDAMNGGVWCENGGNTWTVDSCVLNRISIWPGASRSGDGAAQGINIYGTNETITNNKITNVGYNGINFTGSNVLVEKNYIDSFCSIKDDGGGIYGYLSAGEFQSNRIIRNNIILNGIGAFAGAESYYYEAYGKAAGIYFDENTVNTELANNTIAHGPWGGIYLNNPDTSNYIHDNLVYDHYAQLWINSSAFGEVRKQIISNNDFIAKTAAQNTMRIALYANDSLSQFGTFNNNYYARPVEDGQTIMIDRLYGGGGGQVNISLATWKSTYSQDALSSTSLANATSTSKLKFDYNYASSSYILPLSKLHKDIHNNSYATSRTLPAYGGSLLIQQAIPTNKALTIGGKILMSNGKFLKIVVNE